MHTAQDIARIEAEAQRTLDRFNKVGASIQSKANRKFFFGIVENARINANDTVYTEKAGDDWEAVFKGTVQFELDNFYSQFQGTDRELLLTVKHLSTHFARAGI